MNDFEKLKELLEKVRSVKTQTERFVQDVNTFYETYEQMNSDCDDELAEIDEEIEQLEDELEEDQSDDITDEIENLRAERKNVEEAVAVLEELHRDFALISKTIDELKIG